MATWNLRNRRSFAVLKRLGEMSRAGLILAGNFDRMPPDLSDAERAIAVAEAGQHALTLVIETAGSPEGHRGRAKKVWKVLTPDTGARAAIFLAHGMAGRTERLARKPGHHLSAERQEQVRALLRRHFPWSDGDEVEIADAVDGVDPETARGADEANMAIAFGALRRIVGEDAGRLPGLEHWTAGEPIDAYVADLGWRICFNHSLRSFLAVTDPDGMARARG